MISVHEPAVRYVAEHVLPNIERLGIERHDMPSGAIVLDCGCRSRGSLGAGLALARCCMADLATVELVPDESTATCIGVRVLVDCPVHSCLAAQYAGWPVSSGRYFAMASGPFRAARGREKMLQHLGLVRPADATVGVLEARRLPEDDLVRELAGECGVEPASLTLLVAPTASIAGTTQIVARVVETGLHKLHELGFDLGALLGATGTAPLPPVAVDDLVAMGWTNDAILFGGRVQFWVDLDDAWIVEHGARVPSCASEDHGRTFLELFEACGRDFYKMDPLLFSPAEVSFVNVRTGTTHHFGHVDLATLRRSFQGGLGA